MKRVLITATLALLVAGCSSSPTPRFYTLTPQAPPAEVAAGAPAAPAAPSAAARPSVGVAAVTLPQTVDRPQMVTRTGANEVAISELNRWAGPLKDDVARVLAENLARLSGNAQVFAYPSAGAAIADYRVLVDFQRFDGKDGGEVLLEALWTVQSAGGEIVSAGRSAAREATDAPGYEALASAYSRALAKLAGYIAPALKDLPPAKR
jgi:uncharacterized lipoprotein YmbA